MRELSENKIFHCAIIKNKGLNEPPHSWAVIPPQYTLSRHVEVLLATGSTILTVDAKESQDQVIIIFFLFSFNYSIVLIV